MKPFLMCSAILSLAALSACAPHHVSRDDTRASTTPTLTDYHWTMNRAVDPAGNADQQWMLSRPDQTPATLTFDEQRLVVTGLCNHMGASYSVDETQINISQVASTMKMCPDQALMHYE